MCSGAPSLIPAVGRSTLHMGMNRVSVYVFVCVVIEQARTGSPPRQTTASGHHYPQSNASLLHQCLSFQTLWDGWSRWGKRISFRFFLAGDRQYADASVSKSYRTDSLSHTGSAPPLPLNNTTTRSRPQASLGDIMLGFFRTLMHFFLYV